MSLPRFLCVKKEVQIQMQKIIGKRYKRMSTLKGHSQPLDRAGLDTTFASLKSVYLNPKSNLRVRYI